MKEAAGSPLKFGWARSLGYLVLAGGLGVLGVWLGLRFAKTALVDIGPTDAEYVRGFRDIERDGDVYFRWTQAPSSSIIFPLQLCHEASFRARIRRHSTIPVDLTVLVSGRPIGHATVVAEVDRPYRLIDFIIPRASCGSNLHVTLETGPDERGLGVTVDWVEIKSKNGFLPSRRLLATGAACALLSGLVLALLCAPLAAYVGAVLSVAACLVLGFASSPVAAARATTGAAVGLVLLVPILVVTLRHRDGLATLPTYWAPALAGLSLVTLASRVLFLNPLVFYPDYRVHALVEQTLGRLGLQRFLSSLFEIQYARSLGLQQVGDHWYPFPYPPGAYVLVRALGSVFGLTPLDACLVTAIIAATLVPLLTGMIARRFVSPGEALVAAGIVAVQPLLVRRLSMGYFPGVVGQAIDLIALLILMKVALPSERKPGLTILGLTAVLTAAFLIYTQSIANVGILVTGLLLAALVRRSLARSSVMISVSAAIALTLASGAFYVRYLPVFERVRHGEAQPEEAVLDRLEQVRQSVVSNPTGAADPEDGPDPFTGPSMDPWRGLRRLGARLWRFWGPFSMLLLPGAVILLRRGSDGSPLILPWIAVAVVISLLAAGLPSPNGFQHLKDLEFVTPLLAMALAAVCSELCRASRILGATSLLAWLAYALSQFRAEWLERLLPLADR